MKTEKIRIPAVIYKRTFVAGLLMFLGAYILSLVLLKTPAIATLLPYDLLLTMILDELTTCLLLTILVFIVQIIFFKHSIKAETVTDVKEEHVNE